MLLLNVLATLEDALGEKWSRCCPRFSLALFVVFLGYALALFFTTQAGRYAYVSLLAQRLDKLTSREMLGYKNACSDVRSYLSNTYFFTLIFVATNERFQELTTGYLKYATLWIILAFELLAVTYFYCGHALGKDLKTMLKSKCCWCFGHFTLLLTYILIAVPIVCVCI